MFAELMGVTPAQPRQELIGDHTLGIFRYWMRRCGRMVSRLRISLTQFFQTSATQVLGMPLNSPNTSFESTSANLRSRSHTMIATLLSYALVIYLFGGYIDSPNDTVQ